jgi:glucose-1-phosphate thymidylyltransferase
VPFTLDSAFPFIKGQTILFGFPDIIIWNEDVYVQLLACLHGSDADIVLGLFPAANPGKMDMVDIDGDGSVCSIQIKPPTTHLKWTWIAAAWAFSFTRFMHDYVDQHLFTLAAGNLSQRDTPREIHMGDVIQAAIGTGLKIDKVLFHGGVYIDIGTPEDMITALKMLTCSE